MKPKLWPVSGREVTQHPPEGLNFSSSKIISFWRIGNSSQSAACFQRVMGRQDRGGDVKAILETTEGVRLQVSFGEETALIYLWQIVKEAR